MDSAYDHIQEENFPKEEDIAPKGDAPGSPSLNTEFQEAWSAVSHSPWAATLGGLWGSVRKAGEEYYTEAQKTTFAASTQASKGLNDLINRTRALSLTKPSDIPEAATADSSKSDADQAPKDPSEHPDRPDSLPADIVKEAQSIVSRFRSEAAKRLKDIERAEDAADEALLRLGNNIKSFLQEAVSIAPPTEIIEQDGTTGGSKILFESKDSDGKRIIHTNRFEAQLHVIHCSADGFLKDPAGPEYEVWNKEFDVSGKTDQIATDLDKYPELRKAMEKVVPEKVDYPTFWKRYYFLRRVAELEEQRRKELLKGATTNAAEEVGWDEESDDETNTPNAEGSTPTLKSKSKIPSVPPPALKGNLEAPKPHDLLSQPDSEASYDIISAATSKAGGSPREIKKVEEESDEEDWE